MKPSNVVTAVALAAAAAFALAAGDEPPVGQQVKEFPCVDVLNMRPTTNPLKSLKGRVVLFIHFQTWYPKCVDAIGDLNKLYDKFGPGGLTPICVAEQERKQFEPVATEKGLKLPVALVDTPTAEQFKRDLPAPGFPWSFLVDVNGKIVWQGHPQMIPKGTIEPHLGATTQPPLLPARFADAQAQLDDGRWAAARKTLLDAAATLDAKTDKADVGWAKGVAAWIEMRRGTYFTEADELCKRGWWWDAWDMMNDFPRRFEAMEGVDTAKAKAAEIRANPDAAKDLAAGDDIVKAKAHIANNKPQNARLILQRLVKEQRGNRHADRAKELLEKLPAK